MTEPLIPIPRRGLINPPISTTHPEYLGYSDWMKWRCAYEAGRTFIERYMVKLSNLESDSDFEDRKSIAYAPSFAKAAINDIKNSIFQRTADVERIGGPKTYQDAIKNLDGGGVDLLGNTMGSFIGMSILPELLVLAKIGVLVDAPSDLGVTLAEKQGKRPYLSVFNREDIINWAPDVPINGFTALLLREVVDEPDEFGLPGSTKTIFRYYRKTVDGVIVQFYTADNNLPYEEHFLRIPEIPFTIFELPLSLMEDVADYQIALLNIESSDISFVRKANYPFYFEYYDPKVEAPYLKQPSASSTGTEAEVVGRAKDTKVGSTHGRRIPKGVDKPGFINPDPETLRVSMEKSQQLKEDIRLLVNLNLMNMDPRRQSVESKTMDTHGLEASLSYIGLELQRGETEIGKYWSYFEGSKDFPKITYPKSYNLQTEADRQDEAARLEKLQTKIPSDTYRRAVAKRIARLTMYGMSEKELSAIEKEIDDADTLTSDPDQILAAHKAGLVDDTIAAVSLGYPKETVEQARKDRAERIRLTLEAQGGVDSASQARGAEEFGGAQSDAEKEAKAVRGKADKVIQDDESTDTD